MNFIAIVSRFYFPFLLIPLCLASRYSFSQSIVAPNADVPSIVDSNAINLPIDLLQLRPNTVSGPRFDLELPDGLSCSSVNGTPPSLNFYGGSTRRDNNYQSFPDFVTSGHSVGAVLSLPLSRAKAAKCDEAYELYLATKRIELIETLYDSGVLSDKHVQELAIKSLLELGFDFDDASILLDSPDSSPDFEQESDIFTPEPFVVGP